MFVVEIEREDPRGAAAAVQRLTGAFTGAFGGTGDALVTTGPRGARATSGDPRAVLGLVTWMGRDGGWWCGIGAGEDVALARAAAADALDGARGEAVAVGVRAPGRAVAAAEVQAVLRLRGVVARRRTPTQWATIDAVGRCGSGVGAAGLLGVSPQAVSKSLRASAWREEADTHALAVRLLGDLGGAAAAR